MRHPRARAADNKIRDELQGLAGRALVLLDHTQRPLAVSGAQRRVLKQPPKLIDEPSRVRHLDHSLGLKQQLDVPAEVIGVRAEDHSAPLRGRLEHVLTAVRDQTAADEGDVASGVKSLQLTDGVDHDDISRAQRLQRAGRLAPQHGVEPALSDDVADSSGALGVPRHQH